MEVYQHETTEINRKVFFYEKENNGFKEIDAVYMSHLPEIGNYFLLETQQRLFLVKDIIRNTSSVFLVVEKSSKYDGLIKSIFES